MSWHVVARADEIGPGQSKLVTARGREIGIFNVNGDYFALANKCPHEGASLCKGRIIGLAEADEPGQYRLSRQGELLRCPWHGWEFDIRTGQSWCDPENTRVRAYSTRVESGEELEQAAAEAKAEAIKDGKAKGPYVAETFQVSVKDNYILVEV
ncbi:MAG TPA: Rieske (2Fe-2S) protein [Xanthobacteraceae bacterium]|nr:Rieske (2Fe-2S) protein [Xanthobacteraceae bacterium]